MKPILFSNLLLAVIHLYFAGLMIEKQKYGIALINLGATLVCTAVAILNWEA